MKKCYANIVEKLYLFKSIIAARKVQTFLWGHANGEWGLEEWRRMFRKRLVKIDHIDMSKPHAHVEFRKRLLQNAALSIALLSILKVYGEPKEDCSLQSNLPEYKKKGPF